MKESIEIVLADREYVHIGTYYPVKSRRKALLNENYLFDTLYHPGDTYRISGHTVAALCGDGTIDVYEF